MSEPLENSNSGFPSFETPLGVDIGVNVGMNVDLAVDMKSDVVGDDSVKPLDTEWSPGITVETVVPGQYVMVLVTNWLIIVVPVAILSVMVDVAIITSVTPFEVTVEVVWRRWVSSVNNVDAAKLVSTIVVVIVSSAEEYKIEFVGVVKYRSEFKLESDCTKSSKHVVIVLVTRLVYIEVVKGIVSVIVVGTDLSCVTSFETSVVIE